MFSFFQSMMYLGGSLIFYGFLLLPVLFLLAISVIYFVFDAIQSFHKRWDLF